MFPKFIVVTTLTTPATPTTPEKNDGLATVYARTQAEADQLVLSQSNKWREAMVPNNVFGPGAPTVQSAVFVQQAPTTAN